MPALALLAGVPLLAQMRRMDLPTGGADVDLPHLARLALARRERPESAQFDAATFGQTLRDFLEKDVDHLFDLFRTEFRVVLSNSHQKF